MNFLGIDPGIVSPGFSVVKKNGIGFDLISAGSVSLNSSKSIQWRLSFLYDFFSQHIADHSVVALSLETPFLGKNTQNFLKLGYVRGVLYLLAAQHSLELYEFSPRQVKLAITGFGGAEKEQVARCLMRFLPVFDIKNLKNYDITDAIAIALCAAFQSK